MHTSHLAQSYSWFTRNAIYVWKEGDVKRTGSVVFEITLSFPLLRVHPICVLWRARKLHNWYEQHSLWLAQGTQIAFYVSFCIVCTKFKSYVKVTLSVEFTGWTVFFTALSEIISVRDKWTLMLIRMQKHLQLDTGYVPNWVVLCGGPAGQFCGASARKVR
jgi:uncharacterized paraquat-inducible protein A